MYKPAQRKQAQTEAEDSVVESFSVLIAGNNQ